MRQNIWEKDKMYKQISLVFIIISMLVLCMGPVSAIDWDTGKVAHIPLFNESGQTGLVDLTDNSYDFSIMNEAALTVDKTAFEFDGTDDYVKHASNADFVSMSTAMTVTAWVNPDAYSAGETIASKWYTGSGNAVWTFGITTGGALRYEYKSITDGSGLLDSDNDTVTVGEGWAFVAATFDSELATEEVKLYKNGVLVANKTVAGTLYTDAPEVRIGVKTHNSLYEIYDGQISDVVFWNRSLSAADIADINTAGRNFVPGAADTTDPTWTQTPANVVFTDAESIGIQYNATDSVAIDTYFINTTTGFSMNTTGYLSNTTAISIGDYSINISVNDTSNNSISTTAVYTITDVSAAVDDAFESWSYNNNDTSLLSDGTNASTLINNGSVRTLESGTNYYYDFNGTTDSMTMPLTVDDYPSTSISVWAKSTSTATGQDDRIISILEDTSNKFHIILDTSGKLNVDYEIGNNWKMSDGTLPDWPLNQWNHIVVLLESGNQKVYLNGNLEYSGTDASDLTDITAIYNTLGAHENGSQDYFDGGIDQIMFFSRIITEAEIIVLNNSGVVLDPYGSNFAWTQTPASFSVPETSSVAVQYNVTTSDTIDTFFINATSGFSMNSTGYFINSSPLSAGAYSINVSVNNTDGDILSETIILTVSPFVVSSGMRWVDSTTAVVHLNSSSSYNFSAYLQPSIGGAVLSFSNVTVSNGARWLRLTGLTENTLYNWSAFAENGAYSDSSNGQITTRISDTLKLLLYSDLHISHDNDYNGDNRPALNTLSNYVLANDYGAMISLGDHTHQREGFTSDAQAWTEFEDWRLRQTNNTAVNKYFWGSVIGNHEHAVLDKPDVYDWHPEYDFKTTCTTDNDNETCFLHTWEYEDFLFMFLDGSNGSDFASFWDEELDLINSTLQATTKNNVLVFVHFKIDNDATYPVTNKTVLRTILEDSGKVLAVFSGHTHANRYEVINSIPYYGLDDMASNDANGYVTLNSNSTHLVVDYANSYRTDVLSLFNLTETIPGILSSTYNHSTATDDAESIVWRTNQATPSDTLDSTPTIRFSTNETTDCRIGITDANWTIMGTDRNCTTTGSYDQVCSLSVADAFVADSGYNSVYLACRNAASVTLMSAASTSGALNVSYLLRAITGYTLDGSSVAIPSATVLLYDQATYAFIENQTSNASGYYQFLLNDTGKNYFVVAYEPTNESINSDCKHFLNVTQ